jgi:histidyl-tRNA synthetase
MGSKFQPPKGMRDFLPEEAAKLQQVLDTCRRVYESYGFQPLETPSVESFELLAAKKGLGEGVKDEIYYFKDKADRELGLRFDLTVPLARIVLSNSNIPKPFKRYSIGKVYRYDNPQNMRWREFWQADVDIIGSASPLADIECISAVIDVLTQLGLEDFIIRVSDRKVLEAALESFGVTKENVPFAFRTIDKLNKIGIEGVKKELWTKNIDADKILGFVQTSGKNSKVLEKVGKVVKPEALKDLKELFELAEKSGIDSRVKLDPSLVRGLDYYTGIVYEVQIGKVAVSCGGGGRYDDLVKNLGGQALPATGISIGVDRVLATLEEESRIKLAKITKIFIAAVSDSVRKDVFQIAQKMRTSGVPCSTDVAGRNLSKQLDYANAMGIPYVIVIGENELKEKKAKIRNMLKSEEKAVKLSELEEWAKGI